MNFNSFGLDPIIISNINKLGYKTPTPIQAQSLPPILQHKDLMGLAQTGTGKTAAFSLPILQRLLKGPRHKIRALVLAPTRELAQQIHDAIMAYAHGTNIRSMTIYGGVSMQPQLKHIKDGVEIVVACPGRLLDHLEQRTIDLSHVEVLVLDEADRMFDMGFIPHIRKIFRYLPKKKQTLLFSATMPGDVEKLAREVLHHPVTVQVNICAPAKTVTQTLLSVPAHLKTELLIHLLHKIKKESVLVFTRTKHTAKKVAAKLEQAGFSATSMQGNLSQNKRMSALKGFRDGSLQILVATDIASRGIDVASISHVINYDIPETVDAYIHRIGRTGRAEKEGEAFTLISDQDKAEVRAIEKVLGRRLEVQYFEDFDYQAKKPVRSLMSAATPKPQQRRRFPHK